MKEDKSALKIITAVILAVLMVIFALQNKENTVVTFWFWDVDLPLVLSLMLMFVIGFVVSLLVMGPIYFSSRRKSKQINEMQQRISQLEQEQKNNNISNTSNNG